MAIRAPADTAIALVAGSQRSQFAEPTSLPAALRRSRRTRVAAWVSLSLLLALVSWQELALEPQAGLDPSWGAALHMAIRDHITFGHDLIFTFGPLGFLSIPTLWYSSTGVAAFVYQLLLRVALCSALFLAARRSYGTAVAVLVAFLVASLSTVVYEIVPFFVFVVWVVDRLRNERTIAVLMAFAGAAAGVELLGKLSTGIALAVLAAIMAFAARGVRRVNLAIVLVSMLLAMLGGWALSGQPWGALVDYAHNAARIVSGYASAMEIEESGLGWENLLAWVPIACGVAAVLHTTTGGTTRRRAGMLLLWLAFCFFQFKEGFVRHDAGHAAIYFTTLLGGFFAMRWQSGRRLVGLGLAMGMFALALIGQHFYSSVSFDPIANARSATIQIGEVASSAERQAVILRGREAVRSAFPLDAPTLALLHGRSVHVSPYQTALAWAYELDWDPLPVFQSYSAYTVGLDQQDAGALESAHAPERILRNLEPGIDQRVQTFDEPATTRAILCHYRQLHVGGGWQVLGRAPSRCGAPVPLSVVHAGWGQSVVVPPPPNPHSFVFVRIEGASVQGLERITALLYKPSERTIFLEGVLHRFVEGTAKDGLLLRAAPGVDYGVPFNLAPNPSTIAVGKAGQGLTVENLLIFKFYAVSVTSAP